MRLNRDKEDSADERWTLPAAQAGYAASGLLDFLRTLFQLSNTHPPFEKHIAASLN